MYQKHNIAFLPNGQLVTHSRQVIMDRANNNNLMMLKIILDNKDLLANSKYRKDKFYLKKAIDFFDEVDRQKRFLTRKQQQYVEFIYERVLELAGYDTIKIFKNNHIHAGG